MTRLRHFTIVAAICSALAGCLRTSYDIADYGSFSLLQSSDGKSYEEFSVSLKDSDKRAPAIEIMLPSGSTFRCDSLTEKDAETCFSSCERYETHFGGETAHHMKCTDKDSVAIVFFKDGRVEAFSLHEGGKFRKVGQSEFMTLPIPEDEMIRVFGKPKRYRRVYSRQP